MCYFADAIDSLVPKVDAGKALSKQLNYPQDEPKKE